MQIFLLVAYTHARTQLMMDPEESPFVYAPRETKTEINDDYL